MHSNKKLQKKVTDKEFFPMNLTLGGGQRLRLESNTAVGLVEEIMVFPKLNNPFYIISITTLFYLT